MKNHIENALRNRRVHAITDQSTSESEPDTVHLLKQSSPAKTLKLSKADLERLQHVCYKCGGESPIQKEDHRSAGCKLYKGTALASYVCADCKIGVHLRSDCLQSAANREKLLKKAQDLDLPIQLEENVHVVILKEEQKNL